MTRTVGLRIDVGRHASSSVLGVAVVLLIACFEGEPSSHVDQGSEMRVSYRISW